MRAPGGGLGRLDHARGETSGAGGAAGHGRALNMDFAAINSPAAAFVAGLVTSLHCAGMCGPLACSLAPVQATPADSAVISSVYHVARLAGYGVLGGLAGGLGRAPLMWLTDSALRWLP